MTPVFIFMEEQDNKIIAQYLEKDAEILKENGVAPKNDPQQGGGSPKSKYWKFVGGFFALLLIGFIGIPAVGQYVQQQEAKTRAEQVENNERLMNELVERLKNDKDGGATAEETLKLFTEALKRGDIEQAGKYFVIEPKERQEMLINRLEEIREEGKFEMMLSDLEKVKHISSESTKSLKVFESFNKDGIVGLSMEITKDNYSAVWKIENLIF